jgi:hypothetical protein
MRRVFEVKNKGFLLNTSKSLTSRQSLTLYFSTAETSRPNPVGWQHHAGAAGTTYYAAACNLPRPIDSTALKRAGELDDSASTQSPPHGSALALARQPDFRTDLNKR